MQPSVESPAPPASERPGFGFGFMALFRGWGFLIRHRETWGYAWIPTLVLLLLFAGVGWLTVAVLHDRVVGWLPVTSSTVGGWLTGAAATLLTVAIGLVGVFVAIALAPPLSSPALEKIIAIQERTLRAPERPPLGFWSEVWCGLRAQVFVVLVALPLLLVLWLLELVAPPLVVVTLPLKVLITSLTMAWNLLDYPLTLRHVRMRDRWHLLGRYKSACIGFGCGFSLLFWIPCGCQIFLLPVGVAAATDLVWAMLRHDPSLLGVSSAPASVLVDRDPQP